MSRFKNSSPVLISACLKCWATTRRAGCLKDARFLAPVAPRPSKRGAEKRKSKEDCHRGACIPRRESAWHGTEIAPAPPASLSKRACSDDKSAVRFQCDAMAGNCTSRSPCRLPPSSGSRAFPIHPGISPRRGVRAVERKGRQKTRLRR
ncbi:hypothetical protein CGRA01v4_08538 [Colletotrichum graminicola]|nr:hypothetical protein CGRA01v4_08538 [Colletotrichum graminicola]